MVEGRFVSYLRLPLHVREGHMAEGKFVALYRVSTEKQGRSGLGLEAQQEAVRSYLVGGNWRLRR